MAPHSSTLAWKIPWTEEPGGLQSMGPLLCLQGVPDLPGAPQDEAGLMRKFET